MADYSNIKTTRTEVQGMMMGRWERGTELEMSEQITAVCLDGTVWELRDAHTEAVVTTINPTAAVRAHDVVSTIQLVSEKSGAFGGVYSSVPSDDD